MFGSFPGSLGRGQQTKFTGPKEPTPLWNQTGFSGLRFFKQSRRPQKRGLRYFLLSTALLPKALQRSRIFPQFESPFDISRSQA